MSQINIEFDNTLSKSEIIMPLKSSSKHESGNDFVDYNMTDVMQTKVFGIYVPIIMINNIIIDFDSINYFSLKSSGRLPELTMTVLDRFNLIMNIDKPGNDNEVRVQILPRFDNTYKKIDLTFFINSIRVNGALIQLSCTYKLSNLFSSKFESFGALDTYNLFKNAAIDNKLGFATNIGELTDLRYIYCDNKSWLELLESEICYSDTSNDKILDWWIDLWDNVNLVDIKERYNTIDSDEDLMIWTTPNIYDVSMDVDIEPIETPAVIHNNPSLNASELFVKNCTINNKSGANISKGSDKVYGIYTEKDKEYLDYLFQDSDVHNDVFTKYEYIGENYGSYNYLLSKQTREGFLQKVNTESIKVTLQSPSLGLMRGHKVNFIRYTNDDILNAKLSVLEETDAINKDLQSNIPLDKYAINVDVADGYFRLDRLISGQYLINSVDIIYNNNEWDYILTLVRPKSSEPILIKTV